jgi:hypothetical protein
MRDRLGGWDELDRFDLRRFLAQHVVGQRSADADGLLSFPRFRIHRRGLLYDWRTSGGHHIRHVMPVSPRVITNQHQTQVAASRPTIASCLLPARMLARDRWLR